MARAQRVASLPEHHFWELTPAEVDGILYEGISEWRDKAKSAAYNAAMICACLYNCHRDPKSHPEPFTPDDFLPSYESEPEPPEPPAPEEVARKTRAAMSILAKINP